MKTDGIGARVTRKEDYRFLTGNGQYTDDIILPRQTYAAFVRSPHAHATINGIDCNDARHRLGSRRINTVDRGMGMRGAHESCVGLSRQNDVVGVLAVTGQKAVVFLARDARANSVSFHLELLTALLPGQLSLT